MPSRGKLRLPEAPRALLWALLYFGLDSTFSSWRRSPWTWVSSTGACTRSACAKLVSLARCGSCFRFCLAWALCTFAIAKRPQHRMLEWGILGALVMRGVMILAGAELIQRFSWVLYVFGAFIVYAGIHMLFENKEKVHPEKSFVFRFASKHLRVTHDYEGEHFFVRIGGKLFATPLFLVLLVVEITDITLAIDSIPAIFGITQDPFIVYTSNVFAILGLRAMYFLLAGVLTRLRFLTVGLSFVLSFIGLKMIAHNWIDIPEYISLIIVVGILLLALIGALVYPANPKAESA